MKFEQESKTFNVAQRTFRGTAIKMNDEVYPRWFIVESWMGNCCGAGGFSNFDGLLSNRVKEEELPLFFSAIWQAASGNGGGYQPYNFFYTLSNSQVSGGNWFHELLVKYGAIAIHEWKNEAHSSSGCIMFKWNIKSIIGKYVDSKGMPFYEPKPAAPVQAPAATIDSGAAAKAAPAKAPKVAKPSGLSDQANQRNT